LQAYNFSVHPYGSAPYAYRVTSYAYRATLYACQKNFRRSGPRCTPSASGRTRTGPSCTRTTFLVSLLKKFYR